MANLVRNSPTTSNRSNRPSDSAFKQQKLPAWQPILTAGTVLPTFLAIGVVFIPVGIGLLVSSNKVHEYPFDYTECQSSENAVCADIIAANITTNCKCDINFTLSVDFEAPVFLYYGLNNYYQNHRRYVKSRDDRQLLGKGTDLSSCDPFQKAPNQNNTLLPIAPCGAIANSLFNDSMELFRITSGGKERVPLLKTGIAWASDKWQKFRNPPGNLTGNGAFKNTVKPPYWTKPVWELDADDPSNNGYQNEDFIVWMRTAALPVFRKLYRRVNHSQEEYKFSLPKGDYVMRINYTYPVASFRGRKRFILSTTCWMGGKNPFLGVAYIVVGSICLSLTVVFLFIHRKYGKRSGSVAIDPAQGRLPDLSHLADTPRTSY